MLSPRKVDRYLEKGAAEMRQDRIKARLSRHNYHSYVRAQSSCSQNAYIKPKTLEHFSLDFKTFDRFQKIKS